jgi:hypothetical protein
VDEQPTVADITALQELMFPSAAMCVRVAAELRLADLLADGPLTLADQAGRTGTASRPLDQTLRVLTVEGVFAEVSPGVFANTPKSTLLREGVPDSQYVMSGLGAADWLWASYGELGHSVRTGWSGFREGVRHEPVGVAGPEPRRGTAVQRRHAGVLGDVGATDRGLVHALR